jgi:hypothetical protein
MRCQQVEVGIAFHRLIAVTGVAVVFTGDILNSNSHPAALNGIKNRPHHRNV